MSRTYFTLVTLCLSTALPSCSTPLNWIGKTSGNRPILKISGDNAGEKKLFEDSRSSVIPNEDNVLPETVLEEPSDESESLKIPSSEEWALDENDKDISSRDDNVKSYDWLLGAVIFLCFVLLSHIVRLNGRIKMLANNAAGVAARTEEGPAKEKITGVPTEVDHDLALKIAGEIARLKNNLAFMEPKVRGVKQISGSAKRMLNNLSSNGYEVVDILGMKYLDGMHVEVSFVQSEKLEPGEQLITKIIKPQVNYHGKMIQSGQIEVSIGDET